ncbi:MAG: DNA-directed RNA polymerase subunit alpha [Candidatus Collierbacteria bacterium GW2011_GWB1_45_35]|uniref:DNA-directed RNA polymerase subunit alpha n=1 Tax=Candidatus Collierbacteria bacterium GW2011_GWB2_45_17 TaxID=1618388 RepID=A0A837IFT6_9BACT|nr:MAG: DNA-directed RNA polymerase subunit alpha [Microgenomates group bacterium GW2011_GWC1_44_23]KKT96199.1 MAG: DNA-directed RNA polymerase subunit alpha [Candidatus Collierbacteria bacterium GW2011_GWA1_45_15]KKU01239.1 MAG: DNA-directed RNA polymerase subunit alpha [Candidatus Collierbacteria bacterium GW2011_GWB2_45_17]KKU05334.1 MAG: DNA-directed RNA polymerase subunit alpha [Candidatus Collierbacteria bacterium GW2011_GWB1_45_35]KKU08481.1 MAG: DNA-directed RNA polymerase subunit alpha
MLEPNFKITLKDKEINSAEVIIEPLPQNFGHTMGNALRRVLLTSLEGGAAVRVKIDGVSHQFSTLTGLKEDILEFVLNLKTLNFFVDSDEPVDIKLKATGIKVVKASDLDLPSNVTIANSGTVLANLTSPKSKLSAVITVSRGMGYVGSEDNATNEIGVIPLDASFSPVIKANYTVEAARVGRSSNYDKVRLSLTTDGTITPEEAVRSAARILTGFYDYVNSAEAYVIEKKSSHEATTAGFVDDLDLPTRVLNALKKAGFNKLADLKTLTLADLRKVKNLGEKSAIQVVEKAGEKGIDII